MALKRGHRPSVDFSFASMSDMVFLLLIYFLLTSTFVKQATIQVDLPTSNSDKPSPGKNYVTVTVDGQYFWGDQPLKDREELRDLISKALKDAEDDAKSVTLRVDKKVIFDDAAFVMGLVAEYEGKIVILTKKE
jgi:biopolymer transport protein ExbD